MSKSKSLMFLLLLAFGALCTGKLNAQGVIIPRPCQRCPPPPRPIPRPLPLPNALPVKSIQLDTDIKGQVATTHVTQVFRNDTNSVLEGTYFFPLPESAAIVEFAIWDGDRKLVGEVRSREEARRIYDEIVRRQRDPGLLEYAGKDLFQASIFPIPARSDKKLELTYTQVLKAESGTVAYRYPLGTGKNASQIVGTVSGRVNIEGATPIRNVYSPTHQIDLANHASNRASLSFESKAGRELNDFQLFYTLSRDDFGMTLLTYRETGKDGYFLLMLSPKNDLAENEYATKDIVFVLDTSGSMNDEGKMEKARSALLFGVRSLRDGDRFNIISFAGEEKLMESGLIRADAAGRRRGAEFVERLRANGGTNINDALQAALKQFDSGDRPKMLVFMTDGLPTVGTTDVERIVANARNSRVEGLRLFTFGVGYDVNTTLLDKLASENRGAADYVEPKEDLEQKVSNFFAKVNYPVLTDLQLSLGGVETDLVYPRNLPDLFKGTQMTLIGRYHGGRDQRDVDITLRGRTGRNDKTFTYENVAFPLRDERNDFIPRLWATRRVGWLMESVRSNGETKELRDEIVELGTRFGIVTPYTSYLALEPGARDVDDRRADNSSAPRPIANRPINGRAAGSGGGFGVMSAPATSANTGAVAVRESKKARTRQESVTLDGADEENQPTDKPTTLKRAGSKTFYLENGIWTDSEFKAGGGIAETTVRFGSDEYFELLKREPKLAEYFALGEKVVVVFNGRIYRVTTAGN